MSDVAKSNLRWWLGKGQNAQFAELSDNWLDRLQTYFGRLAERIDWDNDPLEMIDLLAWQRDIDRLPAEPEALYRNRVRYALLNAKDAGSAAGFVKIWERLGLGKITQAERVDAIDWDVIRLCIDEYTFGKYLGLFDQLIAQYGRTCRRYAFESQVNNKLEIRGAAFGCTVLTSKATL